jgi:hypothetical protein
MTRTLSTIIVTEKMDITNRTVSTGHPRIIMSAILTSFIEFSQ